MSENIHEGQELNPEEKRTQIVEKQKQELLRRREAEELEQYDYEVNNIWYLQQANRPLTRKDIGNHAILIRPNEFENLQYLEYISADGEKITLDLTEENFDTQNPLIIFPEELGEENTPE